MTKPDEITRRSFLVAMGSVVLGRFILPVPPEIKLPAVRAATGSIEPDLPRTLLAVPVWVTAGPQPCLLWIEKVEGDPKPRVMIWALQGDPEMAEAKRLVEAAERTIGQSPRI
jgi:hypothetical protein